MGMFDEFKCRCSALGALFTEPKAKADKDAGLLSATAKTYLLKAYKEEVWGRRKDISTKQIQKGILCEPALIELLAEVDGKPYEKNTERKSNDWITGEPDIIFEDLIIDGKASYEPDTFLPHLITLQEKKEIDKGYNYQLQGYMWLFDKPKARLSYGLVNADESTINKERYWLLNSMDVISEDSPEFRKAEAELLMNLTYDDIPESQRIINFDVVKDEDFISRIPDKVKAARLFLNQLHELHIKLNK